MNNIVESLKAHNYPNPTRHTVYNHEKRLRIKSQTDGSSVPSVVSAQRNGNPNNSAANNASPISAITEATIFNSNDDTSAAGGTTINKGGRPKGSTVIARIQSDKQLNNALEFAATKILEKRALAKAQKKSSLANGVIASIINETNTKFNLKENQLHKATVMSRVNRRNPLGHSGNPLTRSPMADVEPVLAALCVKLVRSGQPLDSTDFLDLATSLVEGTPTEAKIRDHHKRSKASEGRPLLSKKYYNNFLKRHGTLLQSMKASKKDNNRQLWGTFRNMQIMYEVIYKELVDAGIARVLEIPRWVNVEGEDVTTEDEALGCVVEIEIVHPNYFIMGDETGCNTNMKNDGNVGGKKYMGEVGRACNKRAIATDMHFTVLPFTNALGEAVMCSIIFTSDKADNKIKSDWLTGIDITVQAQLNDDGVAFVTNNSGVGRYMPGGPTCTCNGKQVPCFVAASAHGGITSDILTEMLQYMDELELFPRGVHLPTPFLLMDGHGSRFDVNFLQYINDNDHEWCVCIGVPYRTHLWQVGDASSMNGCFKMAVTKAKEEIMQAKSAQRLKPAFVPTDIIPIVNKAWQLSFGNVNHGRKALAERGWNPCNRALLKHKDVLDTKDRIDSENVENETGSINQGNSNNSASVDPLTELSVASAMAASRTKMNVASGKIADVLDILSGERDNMEARRRALDRKLKSDNAITSFDKAKKLTAGKLVAAGRHRLNGDVTGHQVAYIKIKEEEEQKKHERKHKLEFELIAKVKATRAIEESKWVAKHYKTMNTYKKSKKDPALGKTLEVLKQQWDIRKQRPSPRYKTTYLPPTTEMEDDSLVPALPELPAAASFQEDDNNNIIETGLL